MLQLGNPRSSGNSSHPVLGELGQAAKALVSTTGIKLKDTCPVAGEVKSLLDNTEEHEKYQPLKNL